MSSAELSWPAQNTYSAGTPYFFINLKQPAGAPIVVSLVLTEMTKPYSFVESLLYDRIIAPAAAQLVMQLPLQLEAENARGGSALDVGCGGGQIMLDFAQRFPGLRFQGVDLSAAQVKRA
ncbi:MAG: class I SAM-dependent methyltransferase, partial [Pseudomonadota bacterium]